MVAAVELTHLEGPSAMLHLLIETRLTECKQRAVLKLALRSINDRHDMAHHSAA